VHAASWPLERELALSRDLFAMHLLRDPSWFELKLEVDPGLGEVPVPPMILIPLAENAVKHGPAAGHHGTIALTVRAAGGNLLIAVENPGPYRGARDGSAGLPTLSRRLLYAYGGQARFCIGAAGERTVAELSLPLAGPRAEGEEA